MGFLTVFSLFFSNRKMMEVCGEGENRLASELMQHELQIEKDVLDPLSQLAEVRGLSMFHIGTSTDPVLIGFGVATGSPKFAEVAGNTPRLSVLSGFPVQPHFYCSSQVSHYEFCDVMCKRQY